METSLFRPHTLEVNPRFVEIDGLGHLNNAVYLSYTEQARCQLLVDLEIVLFEKKPLDRSFPFTLARTEIDYLNPVFMSDHISVLTRVARVGRKSVTLSFEMKTNHPVARGKQVIVWFDHNKQVTAEIPSEAREKFTKILEPGH